MAVLMLVKDVGDTLSPTSKLLDSGDVGAKFRWYDTASLKYRKLFTNIIDND